MAKSNAVWGIDIGQCALKALRCRPHEKDENRMVVEAFDYIEYPKILTQPEANREELIREALRAVRFAQRCGGRQRGDRRARAKRLGAVHQAAAGRAQEDSRHRQVRSPAADSVRAGRRGLGLSAAGRQRGRRLRARDGSRPVRDEARPGGPGAEAAGRGRHRGRHHPARAAGDLQLHLLRSAQGRRRRTTRRIRRHRRSSFRWAPTRRTW